MKQMTLRIVAGITLTLFFIISPFLTARAEQQLSNEYVMGIFPFIPTSNIEGIFAPLAGEMSRAIGKPIKLRIPKSFADFTSSFRERQYDIAFVQPFEYLEIGKSSNYQPLVSRSDQLTSKIVVKENSSIKSLKDLAKKRFGMPPRSSAVSIMNRVALIKAGINPEDVKIIYLASHQACLQQLLIGSVDACGVSPPGIRMMEHQMKTRFRMIHETLPIPSPLFVVKKEMPSTERAAIKATLLGTELKGVKPELRKMFVGDQKYPFKEIDARDYDVLRSHLKLLGPQ